MTSKPQPPLKGQAIADEDPDDIPMEGLATGLGPAQPMDVDQIERDRAKSTGPRTDELKRNEEAGKG